MLPWVLGVTLYQTGCRFVGAALWVPPPISPGPSLRGVLHSSGNISPGSRRVSSHQLTQPTDICIKSPRLKLSTPSRCSLRTSAVVVKSDRQTTQCTARSLWHGGGGPVSLDTVRLLLQRCDGVRGGEQNTAVGQARIQALCFPLCATSLLSSVEHAPHRLVTEESYSRSPGGCDCVLK